MVIITSKYFTQIDVFDPLPTQVVSRDIFIPVPVKSMLNLPCGQPLLDLL